ncbi:MAG: hypothetical protein PVJ98_02850 [Akkermansiaceae bacterium]|jgi:hypothetical protein
MAKTICDWSKKDLEKDSAKLWKLTRDATFYCRKCGRVANVKKALCKGQKFDLPKIGGND